MRFSRLPQRARSSLTCAQRVLFLLVYFLVAGQRDQTLAQAKLVLIPGSDIGTLAGNGTDAKTKAGAALSTSLGSPGALAYDSAGNLYLADARNHQVSRVDAAGQLTIVAGNGQQGFSGDGSAATAAELNAPGGIAVDTDGAIYIADSGNHRVRRVSSDGIILTVVGSGVAGFGGDGGPAMEARLRSPAALVLDASHALYIADTGNHRIRKLTSDGTLLTAVGSGTEGDDGDGGSARAASLEQPSGLALLPDGRLLIADRAARRVRALNSDGTISAYAVGSNLALRRPAGLAVDAAGSVYAVDMASQMLLHGDADGGAVSAGNGEQGRLTAGAPTGTPLDRPTAVAYGFAGEVTIGDRGNHQVQRLTQSTLSFGDVPAGQVSETQALTLENGGRSPLQVLAIKFPNYFLAGSNGSCASVPFVLQAAAQCTVEISFAPTAQGTAAGTAQVRVSGAAAGSVLLTGNGTASGNLARSITSLRSDGSIAYAGLPVTLTATVAGPLLNAPGGNVLFYDGSNAISTVALGTGTAMLTTVSLQSGQHSIRAVYSGDATYGSSASAIDEVTVVPAPDFSLSAGASSYSGKAGGTVTIPVMLVPVNGTLNHAVQFAVAGLPSGATATFLPATLTLGGDSLYVTLMVQVPTTLARTRVSLAPYAVAACLLLVPCSFRRFRRRLPLGGACLLLFTVGCGSGFRAGTTLSDLNGTHNYTAVITATTQGVLGTTLAHSSSVGLVLSQ